MIVATLRHGGDAINSALDEEDRFDFTAFQEINAHLASQGHRLKTGTIVDANGYDAPSSTKNKAGSRDSEIE